MSSGISRANGEEGLEILQGGISTAAKHLGIDPRTLYGAAQRGEFWPAVRIGRRWLIPLASWRRFLGGRGLPPTKTEKDQNLN